MTIRTLKTAAVGSVSALALAATAGTAAAETGIDAYGFVHAHVDYQQAGENDIRFRGTAGYAPTRFGFRGNHELAPGITGLANVELALRDESQVGPAPADTNGAFGLRLANAGLRFDGVGTVTLGSQWSTHYTWVTSQTDLMVGDHRLTFFAPVQTQFRVDRTAQFMSENFGGFQFSVMTQANGEDPDNDINFVQGAVRYQQGPLTLAASIIDRQEDNGETTIAAAGTYDFDVAALSATVADFNEADMTNFELGLRVPVTEQWAVSAIVNRMDAEEEVVGYGAEARYTFQGGNFAYVGLSDTDADGDNMRGNVGYAINF